MIRRVGFKTAENESLFRRRDVDRRVRVRRSLFVANNVSRRARIGFPLDVERVGRDSSRRNNRRGELSLHERRRRRRQRRYGRKLGRRIVSRNVDFDLIFGIRSKSRNTRVRGRRGHDLRFKIRRTDGRPLDAVFDRVGRRAPMEQNGIVRDVGHSETRPVAFRRLNADNIGIRTLEVDVVADRFDAHVVPSRRVESGNRAADIRSGVEARPFRLARELIGKTVSLGVLNGVPTDRHRSSCGDDVHSRRIELNKIRRRRCGDDRGVDALVVDAVADRLEANVVAGVLRQSGNRIARVRSDVHVRPGRLVRKLVRKTVSLGVIDGFPRNGYRRRRLTVDGHNRRVERRGDRARLGANDWGVDALVDDAVGDRLDANVVLDSLFKSGYRIARIRSDVDVLPSRLARELIREAVSHGVRDLAPRDGDRRRRRARNRKNRRRKGRKGRVRRGGQDSGIDALVGLAVADRFDAKIVARVVVESGNRVARVRTDVLVRPRRLA